MDFLFFRYKHVPFWPFGLLSWMSAHLDSETVQEPWMCQCTYCKDVYVGLICLRVIYLPKDHDSGEIYLKYVAFYLSLWQSLRLRTNTGRFFLFFFTSAILLFQSQPGKTTITAGAQSTTTQATGNSQSEIIHTPPAVVFHTSWKLFVFSYCWPLLSLYNSQLLSIL